MNNSKFTIKLPEDLFNIRLSKLMRERKTIGEKIASIEFEEAFGSGSQDLEQLAILKAEEKGLSFFLEEVSRFGFVSIYAIERQFGGPEEGGWFFDKYVHLESIDLSEGSERVDQVISLEKQRYSDCEGKFAFLYEEEAGHFERLPAPVWQ